MRMGELPGMERPALQALPQIEDRLTFLYLEHCQVNREDSAILIRDDRGTTRVPAAAITVLLLGPGTTVTHRAVELIGDAGVGIVWVGEHGVRFYASGRPLTHRAHLLMKQAKMVSNQRTHLAVVRKMYQLRFPNEDVSGLTTQQLRGREGSRVRKAYRAAAEKWKIPWNGREFDPDNFSSGDPVNQALSAGHACLYGLAHAVIVALGCAPGLGFIHLCSQITHHCVFIFLREVERIHGFSHFRFQIVLHSAILLSSSVMIVRSFRRPLVRYCPTALSLTPITSAISRAEYSS